MSQSFTNQLTNANVYQGGTAVSVSNPLYVTSGGASTTGTNTSVAGTTTNSTTLLASNSSRLGATIFNSNTVGGGVILYVSLGSTCTPTNFTLEVAAGGYYEVPFGYTGIITGVFSSATGSANITETT